MEQVPFTQRINDTITSFIGGPDEFRAIIILFGAIIFFYWLSRFFAKGIIYVAQKISGITEHTTRNGRIQLYRQVETYLSVAVAIVRVVVVIVGAYLTWRILAPRGSTSLGGPGFAAIGASAFFVVFAGQTLGILLRDITAGATMIVEKWFTIGDFIKIEPFMDTQGVVERMTLRSTKLRSLNGEVVWIHNQQIQGVHVTPNALRTLAVDLFVHDRVTAEKVVSDIIAAMPTGPTMLARPLRVKYAERWGDDLWRITVVGQTAPGREWLIENYFVSAVNAYDEGKKKSEKLLVYPPMARFADPVADKRFKRAVLVKKESPKDTTK